ERHKRVACLRQQARHPVEQEGSQLRFRQQIEPAALPSLRTQGQMHSLQDSPQRLALCVNTKEDAQRRIIERSRTRQPLKQRQFLAPSWWIVRTPVGRLPC